MMDRAMTTTARPTYHHGDLRRALVAEGVALARVGGPEAVTLREVARRLDVSPTAIYRHYPDREALLGAVACEARQELARGMLAAMARVEAADDAAVAIGHLRAIGQVYLDVGRDEPMLLATAFAPIPPPPGVVDDPSPWQILNGALDELVATGAMPAERRPGAEVIAWAIVHGYTLLQTSHALDTVPAGPFDEDDLLDSVARALDIVGF
jgi:AcrR family transcriptional regulator